MNAALPNGVVYSETVVHSAPALYADEAPYQIAILDLPGVGRKTVRIIGERVEIGDVVSFHSYKDGTARFRRCPNAAFADSSNK